MMGVVNISSSSTELKKERPAAGRAFLLQCQAVGGRATRPGFSGSPVRLLSLCCFVLAVEHLFPGLLAIGDLAVGLECGNARELLFFHGLGKEAIRFFRSFAGHEKVRTVKVEWRYVFERHEFAEIDIATLLGGEPIELFVGNNHVTILFKFKSA